MKIFLRLLFIVNSFNVAANLHAQTPTIKFDRNYPGDGISYTANVIQTDNGSYVTASCYKPDPLSAFIIWVFKTNNNGDTLWKKYYGGPDIVSTCIIKTPQGLIIGAKTNYRQENLGAHVADIVIIGIDSIGNVLWRKQYDNGRGDGMNKIIPVSNGNYILLGYTDIPNPPNIGGYSKKAYIMMIDPLGNKIWDKTFGDRKSSNGQDLMEKSPNNYYLLYATSNFNSGLPSTMTLININANGDSLWSQTYDNLKYRNFKNFLKINNNDILISAAVWRDSVGGKYDDAIIKLSLSGNFYGAKIFGDSLHNSMPSKIIATKDNGYMVCGYTYRYSDTSNERDHLFIRKFDKDLNEICNWIYVNGNQGNESAIDIIQTTDGGYLIAGSLSRTPVTGLSFYNTRLLKIDNYCQLSLPACNLKANFTYYKDSINPNYYHFKNTTAPQSTGDSIHWSFGDSTTSNQANPGHIYNKVGKYPVCLRVQMRYSNGLLSNCINEKCDTITVSIPPPPANSSISIYPNPATNMLYINYPGHSNSLVFSIYNLLGQVIKKGILSNLNPRTIDIRNLAAEMYMLKITDGNKVESRKFIKR